MSLQYEMKGLFFHQCICLVKNMPTNTHFSHTTAHLEFLQAAESVLHESTTTSISKHEANEQMNWDIVLEPK